jgi:hypothetical protein
MFLGKTYITEEIAGAEAFDPIEAGWYDARITDAKIKDTKAGNGKYIALRFDITGPSYQGRVLWANINIMNPNPQAEQIGMQQLGDIARAAGIEVISDTDQLLNSELQIKVTLKHDEQYGDGNDIKGYKVLDRIPAAISIPTQTRTSSAPLTGKNSTPPWAARK